MTAALTESAAWGGGGPRWWTEFKPSLQTTFIVHVGTLLGEIQHEVTWGPAVGPWPLLPCLSLP